LSLVCRYVIAPSGAITPTKINRADEANINGTWARPIRDDRSPGCGSKSAKGIEPHERRRTSRGKDHSPGQAAKARADW
jgi:hypothetical protein